MDHNTIASVGKLGSYNLQKETVHNTNPAIILGD